VGACFQLIALATLSACPAGTARAVYREALSSIWQRVRHLHVHASTGRLRSLPHHSIELTCATHTRAHTPPAGSGLGQGT
jgi:hypothetical protein